MGHGEITVLLVDDEEMIRECIAAYLEDDGLTVLTAASGEQALDTIAASNVDVCISDMRLTGMDGEEFILRAHAVSPRTGYMIHTGTYLVLSDELKSVGMTAEDVLLKPVHNLSKLADKVRQLAVAGRTV